MHNFLKSYESRRRLRSSLGVKQQKKKEKKRNQRRPFGGKQRCLCWALPDIPLHRPGVRRKDCGLCAQEVETAVLWHRCWSGFLCCFLVAIKTIISHLKKIVL